MADSGIPYILEAALASISEVLDLSWLEKPPVWLLGGSCGLLLHGVQLSAPPRDIDLYADLEDAEVLHSALSCYSVDGGPEEDYSGGCYSLRSRYRIGDARVELVCGFQISSGTRRYAVDVQQLLPHALIEDFNGIGFMRLMPAAHELVFNLLRCRVERCSAIANFMKVNLAVHLPLLQQLVLENGLDEAFGLQLEKLLGVSTSIQI
ncbi:hypothetical protein NST99_22575 [Paenibacillus sp. FSL L8-0470]|uniref:hypothetical protein n=1 Tax=unclassified Paenibacillus TaxID=185978 RepID=UPI0030FCE843